jgi:hypothetical protein
MTPARAAEVLRGVGRKPHVLTEAERQAVPMGADALEFLAWLFEDKGAFNGVRCDRIYQQWNGEDSFLDYARAEWEKERKG